MSNTMTMGEFLTNLKRDVVTRHLIPLEMGMGWPLLSIENKKLYVTVPFYKALVQPEDKTLIYPLSHTITCLWPGGLIVDFKSLQHTNQYKFIDITTPVGTFRHEAVKNLNKNQYKEKKLELYKLYDELIASLFSEEPYSKESEQLLKTNLNILMEPSLKPYYKLIAPQFCSKFLQD